MDIISLTEDTYVTIKLDCDELRNLCNALYHNRMNLVESEEGANEAICKLEADLCIARDLAQYGHLDGFSLAQIAKLRHEDLRKNGVSTGGSESDKSVEYIKETT